MDANKEDANICITKALLCLRQGDVARAEKLLVKAHKMFPSAKSEDLLAKLRSESKPKEKEEKKNDEWKGRSRKFSPARAPKLFDSDDELSRSSSPEVNYTREQVAGVERIQNCKNFYEVLNVTKESTDTEIKKSYKKLALQLHPDKNHAPGAAEAFKHIGNAAATLTDVEKRKQYDLFESEERLNYRHRNRNFETAYARGFAGDDTAEELFNLFFGNGFQTSYVRTHRTRFEPRDGNRGNEGSNMAPILNILPILALILISMISSVFISDTAVYSLHPGTKFNHIRRTTGLRVPYYVKDNFDTDYKGSVQRLEESVEEEFKQNLRSTCYKEQTYKNSMRMRAQYDRSLLEKVNNIQTPGCDLYERIKNGGTVPATTKSAVPT